MGGRHLNVYNLAIYALEIIQLFNRVRNKLSSLKMNKYLVSFAFLNHYKLEKLN